MKVKMYHHGGRLEELEINDRSELVGLARLRDESTAGWTVETYESMLDCYGDPDDMPEEAVALFNAGSKEIIVSQSQMASPVEYFDRDDPEATTEQEWAENFLFHDLQRVEFEE